MGIFTTSQRGGLYARLRDRGYIIEDARLGGSPLIRITSPSGRVWMTGKKMAYPMNNAYVHQIADNKRLSYELASGLGIKTPAAMYADRSTSTEDVEAFLQQYRRVVVKPLDSYKSRGVTLEVTSVDTLRHALDHAYTESSIAIVQEQVEGEEYRFTVLDGKVVSVLRRERPQVIGDGASTVRQLVELENTERQNLDLDGITYPQWTEDLVGDAVTSEDILGGGEMRLLSGATLVSQGASVYELRGEVDRSYVELAERFAMTLGAGLAAIDMFIPDHQKPASQSDYWFNECNTSPSLRMYVVARNGSSRWIIEKITNTVDKYLNINA